MNSTDLALSLEAICSMIGGKLYGHLEDGQLEHGFGDTMITGIQPLETAGSGDLSFFSPTSKRNYRTTFAHACESRAAAILTKKYYEEISSPQILVENPMQAVIALANHLHRPSYVAKGIHPQACVDSSAILGLDVAVGAFCVIGRNVIVGAGTKLYPHAVIYDGALIGENCVIHSHAVIREHVRLGDDCHIQPGAVIGGDGFGYYFQPGVGHVRIPHIGGVVLESRVDLGSNSTIDRGMLGDTRIGTSTKIDNLCMVGHNVQIGRETLLCGQVGISGSTKIGNNVTLAGKVGVADHVNIGNNVRAAAMTGISGDIPDGIDVGGYPAQPVKEWRKSQAAFKLLPRLIKGHEAEVG